MIIESHKVSIFLLNDSWFQLNQHQLKSRACQLRLNLRLFSECPWIKNFFLEVRVSAFRGAPGDYWPRGYLNKPSDDVDRDESAVRIVRRIAVHLADTSAVPAVNTENNEIGGGKGDCTVAQGYKPRADAFDAGARNVTEKVQYRPLYGSLGLLSGNRCVHRCCCTLSVHPTAMPAWLTSQLIGCGFGAWRLRHMPQKNVFISPA